MKAKISEKRARYILDEVHEYMTDAEYACRQRKASSILEAYAFFRGRQYRRKDWRGIPTDELRGEAAEVINICRPIVNASAAEVLSEIVSPRIPSAKDDQAARARADMTERLGQSFTRNGVINFDEYHRTVLWAEITGASWMKCCWDPDAGRSMPDTIDTGFEGELHEEKPEFDPFGEIITHHVYEGEIRCEFVSTIDGLPDPSAKTPGDLKRPGAYFFHRKLLPLRQLADMRPLDWRGEPTERRWDIGTRSAETTSQAALSDNIDSPFGYGQINASLRSQANIFAELVEYWELPSKRYPHGRFLIFSGRGLLLHIGPNPYFPARLPFILFEGPNKNPTTLYPDGLLADILGIQRSTNRVESKKLEIINKMGNPHMLVPKNSGIEANTWGDIPGQIIEYNKGFPPSALPGVDIPQTMFTYAGDQLDRAKFLTGHSDLAQGQVNAEASGRSVVFATENAQRQNSAKRTGYRNSLIELMQHCVWHARQRYDDGRMVRVIGPNNDLELAEFRSDEFDFDNDFAPEPFSDEPQSFAARVSTAIELKAGGIFDDDPSAERARRLIGGSYIRKSAYDPFDADRQRARREQLYTLRDPFHIPQVALYDIHEIHLEEHNLFRKSVQYEQLGPVARKAFDDHCDLHSLAILNIQAAQQERENAGALARATEMGMGTQPGQPPPPGADQPMPPGVPSPPDGGTPGLPAPPPTINEFAQMSDSEQRASDQA